MKDKLKVKMVCYKDTPDASILEKELEGGWACMKRSWIVLKQTSLRRTRKLSVIWWRWICDAILATRSTSRILKDLFFSQPTHTKGGRQALN